MKKVDIKVKCKNPTRDCKKCPFEGICSDLKGAKEETRRSIFKKKG